MDELMNLMIADESPSEISDSIKQQLFAKATAKVDELKFSKFVGRLRKRFGNMFNDMLRTQLILKNVITPEDWEKMSDHIQYDFLYDNHFAELKEAELMQERLGLLATADPYIGKYYSVDHIRRKILRQTDEEIVMEDKQMAAEKAAGIILPTEQEMMLAAAAEQSTKGNLGKPPAEPDIDDTSTEAPESPGVPKGGEI